MDVPVRRPCLILLASVLGIAACRTGNDEPLDGTAAATQPSRVISVPADQRPPEAAPEAALVPPHPGRSPITLVPAIDTPPEPDEDDSGPCGKKGPKEKGRRPGHDGRFPVNVCDALFPFPASIGHPEDGPERGIRYLRLSGGSWTCPSAPDDWRCGGIDLKDVVAVDVDRDGRKESIATFFATWGGNTGDYFVYAYEAGPRGARFKAQLDQQSDQESNLGHLEPYGRHCVKVLGSCEKPCHACPGRPCHRVYAWDGRRFRVAETWMGDWEWGDVVEQPVRTRNRRLLERCGIVATEGRKR